MVSYSFSSKIGWFMAIAISPAYRTWGMRDLSEALPLVEQAEAALDVLDKKARFGDGWAFGRWISGGVKISQNWNIVGILSTWSHL